MNKTEDFGWKKVNLPGVFVPPQAGKQASRQPGWGGRL